MCRSCVRYINDPSPIVFMAGHLAGHPVKRFIINININVAMLLVYKFGTTFRTILSVITENVIMGNIIIRGVKFVSKFRSQKNLFQFFLRQE